MVRGTDWQPELGDVEIQAYTFDEAGEAGLALASFIAEKEPISGVDILEAFPDDRPSGVRKVLYDLMEARIAEYQKDTDAKGWETFIWRTTLSEAKYVLLRRWEEERESLTQQLRFERDHEFYACPHRHRRMIFEDAVDVAFRCPVCDDALNPYDNGDVITALQERIDELAKIDT